MFLLAEQSNMAGRCVVTEKDTEKHPKILMLSKEGIMSKPDKIYLDSNSQIVFGKKYAHSYKELLK